MKNEISEIDGHRIETVTQEFNSANVLRMRVGTDCPRGGDAGHGGRTVIILDSANGSTEMHCTQRHGKIELVFRGDTECETLIDALAFASETLRKMQADNQRGV